MRSRATCILLIEIFWALGTVFEVLLAILVMPTLGWRWLLALSTIPLFIFAFLCFWLPESARYDVLTGNQEKALNTLKRIAAENNVPMPLGKLIVARQEDRGKIQDLFSPHFRWTTILLWFIWFSNAFSYYGVVLLTTELFQEGGACGGLLVTLWAIDRLGRRKTMALCFFVFSLCIVPLYACVGRCILQQRGHWVWAPVVGWLGLELSSHHLWHRLYCCCCLLAAIASCALPIETTGRGLQESSHREWGQEMMGRASDHSPGGIPHSSSGSQD
ncbi:Synaptic vesicle 2-related protein [Labeo rohita]|uniref:Synaptic vesicle 2-related protein n=1 Tax=Labeo rohita TaxID=84645 RepID=A0ABQ8MPV0_LABRO|nr:Synaptic vesicle 2-related protein [Labeo rohita]